MATLKDYAKEAKARMKSGFWEEVKEQRQRDVKRAAEQGKTCGSRIFLKKIML